MKKLFSKIEKVTVFADRATVTRAASCELEVGEHYLFFEHLPKQIDANSIHVSGKGNAVLSDVKLKTVQLENIADETIQKLTDEKKLLVEQKEEIEESTKNALNELEFIQNITRRLTESNSKSNINELDPSKWIEMVKYYRLKQNEIGQEIRINKKEKKAIDEKIDKIKRQLKELGHNKFKSENRVELIVNMKEKGKLFLELSYIVYGASWYPVYDLRVSSEKKTMNILYNAFVKQNTSESWEDVKLELSTAQPAISGIQPEMDAWHLSFFHPEPRRAMAKAKSKKRMMSMDFAKEGVEKFDEMIESAADIPEMEVESASVKTGATSVVFEIGGNSTIINNNDLHKVGINQIEFPATFKYSTTPKLSEYAYLKAKIINDSEYPFLAGETNIFFDNNFVANSELKLVAPTEEFWTYLGVDEAIKVKHKFIKKYQKEEGLINKTNKIFYEYILIIKNNKKTKEEIIVSDQIPISQHEDIKVELLEPEYKKDTEKLKINENKFIEWNFTLEPQEEKEISLKFSVEYPRKEILEGLD